MKWWAHIMAFLTNLHHPRAEQSQQVDAAFAQMLASREQTAEAVHETVASAIAHSARVEGERHRIMARTAEAAQKWPDGRTSAMRDQVNALVARQERRDRDH